MTEMGVEVLRKFCYVIMEDCFNRGIPICDGAMEIYWSEFLECATLRHFFYEKMGYKELDHEYFHTFFNLHKEIIINRCKYLVKKDNIGRKAEPLPWYVSCWYDAPGKETCIQCLGFYHTCSCVFN